MSGANNLINPFCWNNFCFQHQPMRSTKIKVKLTLKIKGKTYKATTNAKGKATFKIKNLKKKGTFKATIKFKGNAYYNAVTKKVKIKIK